MRSVFAAGRAGASLLTAAPAGFADTAAAEFAAVWMSARAADTAGAGVAADRPSLMLGVAPRRS
jgi:hypothetical protein